MMRMLWLALLLFFFAGCGSGGSPGGIGDGGGHGLGPGTGATSATVTVSTQAASGETAIYAAEFTLQLPAGVTVAADAATGEVAAGVIRPFDSRAMAAGRYSPATAAAPASLKVNVVDPLGFTVGDLATISCSIASGTSPSLAGFALTGFSARNANGISLSNFTPRFSVVTQ